MSAPVPERSVALSPWERWLGGSVVLASALCVCWPAFGPLQADSFPLSTYPMFARPRGKPRMHQLLGLTRDGEVRRLTPEHLGTSEVLQAKALIDRAARSPHGRREMCRQVATRVLADAHLQDVTQLELRLVRFDPISYFTQRREPTQARRLVRCRVADRTPTEAP